MQDYVRNFRAKNPAARIGFVPTMGALHQGHLQLVCKCSENEQLTIASIFVNPTQFTNPEDLARYPRNEPGDLELLLTTGCDAVFLPSVEEIYHGDDELTELNLGILDEVMEGKSRPGHFRGVATVVEKLFRIVGPDSAWFGEKDFQQLAVIRKMTQLRVLNVVIVEVPTVRNRHGLALSSRNQRLSREGLQDALIMIETLRYGQELCQSGCDISTLGSEMLGRFNQGKLKLEYLEVLDEISFQPASTAERARGFIAAFCEDVRLIDNLALY